MTNDDSQLALKKAIHDAWVAKVKRMAIFKLMHDKMIAHENAAGPPPTPAEFEDWRMAVDESLHIKH